MDISISPTLEKFAEEQVKVGAYSSISEVVNEALALLKEQQEHDRFDDMTDDELVDVRRKLQLGIDSLERGEGTEWNVEEAKAEGRRLQTENRKTRS